MKLFLIRHASANDLDPEKRLTIPGIGEAKAMAAHLAKSVVTVDTIYHSDKARAEETAQHMAGAIHAKLVFKEGLHPMDDVKPIGDWINTLSDDTILVGHMPFMSKLASYLLNGNEDADIIQFEAAGSLHLEKTEEGRWIEHWMMDPSLFS